MLIKDKQLSFGNKLKSKFRVRIIKVNDRNQKFERQNHQGADQDVDTDEDNMKFGMSQLKLELSQAISDFQKGSDAISQINNLVNDFQ